MRGAKKAIKPRENWRANYLGVPQCFNLSHACALINESFDEYGCFLVGSATERRDFRDVDVRFIMADAAFDRLFGDPTRAKLTPLWCLLTASISCWLSQQSGLPVDFQIQRQSEANKQFPRGIRDPIGLYLRRKDGAP